MKKFFLSVAMITTSYLVASTGAELTKSCVGCHGMNFEKAPLGRTHHIVKGDSNEDIVNKLKDYQTSTESDEMIMKIQVKNLSNDEIQKIADYITKDDNLSEKKVSKNTYSKEEAIKLTKSCVGCHGMNFEKAPFGKSHHIVKGKSKEDIATKIKYYQNPKEADERVMQYQVKNLTNNQIDTIAEYISNIK